MVGSAVTRATKLHSTNLFNEFNRATNNLRGVGAMSDSIKKISETPILPHSQIKAAIQPGN